jgi:hypothetical protein
MGYNSCGLVIFIASEDLIELSILSCLILTSGIFVKIHVLCPFSGEIVWELHEFLTCHIEIREGSDEFTI